jgi:hypothetical protein
MKKYYIIFLILIVFSPFFAYALDANTPSIVPCARNYANDTNMCTLCDLIKGIWFIVDYAMKILFFVALLMLVIAGIMYIVSTGNQGLISTAKQLMWNVLIGFAIVLLAWLTIRIIMNVITADVNRATGKTNWFDFNSDLNCHPTPMNPSSSSTTP